MLFGKRHLLIALALAICAFLQIASVRTRRIIPARPEVPVATEGFFQPDGEYPGEALANRSGVRAWGSWSGSDDYAGTITIGPFPAPRQLRLGISGYPGHEGNALRAELADGSRVFPLEPADVGERWQLQEFELPAEWENRPMRIIGTDTATGVGGWLALTEPVRGGRGDGNNALIQSLAAFTVNGLLLGLVYCAAAQQLGRIAGGRGAPAPRNGRDAHVTSNPRAGRPCHHGPGVAWASRPWGGFDQAYRRCLSLCGMAWRNTHARWHGRPARGLNDSEASWRSTLRLDPHWIPLGAGAVVAVCGYAAFWAYFAHPIFGMIVSWSAIAAAACATAANLWSANRTQRLRMTAEKAAGALFPAGEVRTVLLLMVTVGAFYLGLLHLFPTSQDFYTLAANRYREAMPSDNVLPHITAERLFASESLQNPVDEWLSSDRPPLQAGWQLLTWPVSQVLGTAPRTAGGTSAMWFQLLWIAAAYGLLRSFAVERVRAAGWIATLALCGFFLQNTTYTWPKLSAGAFACGAFSLLAFPGRGSSRRANATWAALFAGLAWLSHGGVAFSFLALLPLLAWHIRRGAWRDWRAGTVTLLLLVTPWLAYQTFYDPPANRLFKWHLAGQSERDARGTWETIRESYAKLGWREAWSNKVSNFHSQVLGNGVQLADLSAATAVDRRAQEFFHTRRALTWWPFLAVFAVVLSRRRVFRPARDFAVLAGWLLLTIVIWCLLMFGQYQAVIHHGSYALMIGLFALFSIVLERSGRGWLALIAGLQAVTLGTTWAIGNSTINGPTTGLFFVLVSAAALGGFVIRAFIRSPGQSPASEDCDQPAAPRGCGTPAAQPARRPEWVERIATSNDDRLTEQNAAEPPAPHDPSTSGASVWQRGGNAFRAWWANPCLNVWVLAALAFLLFLRKPHALHTPQLWAEDGSIFLMQTDLHGLSALLMPYMGYLHTIPRLIAALAPPLLDPAWWPALYNGVSFAIWLAVLARFFTPRFNLPGKPWLAFALIAVAHPGEVHFNITNLQWLTAFVLIQQVLITPPANMRQRVTDLLILAIVTLTGPFGIAFLPLFVWRWWRERSRDNLAALVVVIVCAAVQAWFVVKTGPRFEFQAEPLRFMPNLVVFARRLVVWPVLGPDLALSLPPKMIAAIGGTFLIALIGWTLRPDARRPLRLQVLAAFCLITLAALHRTRPDTWAADTLEFGDRYFYIPRVLLAWLLIWEFDAMPRTVASTARAIALAAMVMNATHYTVRAPKDYAWATHVEPIRQGVPAELPTLPEGWLLEYRGRPQSN